ncbi:MAG: Nif3-like dinuclear metal center hexameric protein [Acidobacteriota bacterium]
MILLSELENFLNEKYKFNDFEDYCINGLVIEGEKEIRKIGFGVSFNGPFLDKAISSGADAILVHHGIFQKRFFSLRGIEKARVKKILNNNMSLFGIHLPMDAHPEIGHNALLLKAIGITPSEPMKWGFFGSNVEKRSLMEIIDIFHSLLHPGGFKYSDKVLDEEFNLKQSSGFMKLGNGPEIPDKIFMASGGSTGLYEEAIASGADTFICGEIQEQIPAISLETGTNFINLGHYYSEKPGVIELMKLIGSEFDVETEFIEVPNPI